MPYMVVLEKSMEISSKLPLASFSARVMLVWFGMPFTPEKVPLLYTMVAPSNTRPEVSKEVRLKFSISSV